MKRGPETRRRSCGEVEGGGGHRGMRKEMADHGRNDDEKNTSLLKENEVNRSSFALVDLYY